MSLRPIDLTTALRPALLPDEILLFVQDAVGLYAGKAKLAGHQNGHAYLTSHRACYVDNERPRRSPVAVYLRDVERCELHVSVSKRRDILNPNMINTDTQTTTNTGPLPEVVSESNAHTQSRQVSPSAAAQH